jgi:hypothetical protein
MADASKAVGMQKWLDRINPKMDPRDGKTLAEKLDAVWAALSIEDDTEGDRPGGMDEFMSLLEFMANHAQSAGMWSAIGEWCRRHDWES